uniref:Phosphatidylinositol N-acetylglucosaminyltransferase subunit C n=1 Tax=Onchocerca volvulus TaxID=6282 RepID=A0A8R1XVQ0_ONCVO
MSRKISRCVVYLCGDFRHQLILNVHPKAMGGGRNDHSMQEEKRKKWRKILYERQPFEDEYSGGSEFLKELRTNITVVEYSFMEAVCGASLVMLHSNAIIFYYLVFDSINTSSISSVQHFSLIFAIALVLYTVYLYMIRPRNLQDHFYTFITLLGFGYVLTPVIRTLTDTISTDTIYAMSFMLFLTSFIFHDYAMVAPLVSTVLSVNLSLAASVCLVSRVPSNESAFGLLALSMLLFSYWPQMRNVLYRKWPRSSLILIIFSSPLLFTALYELSHSLSVLYILVVAFVVLFCPSILMIMQPWKSTKHGPWDEATATFER